MTPACDQLPAVCAEILARTETSCASGTSRYNRGPVALFASQPTLSNPNCRKPWPNELVPDSAESNTAGKNVAAIRVYMLLSLCDWSAAYQTANQSPPWARHAIPAVNGEGNAPRVQHPKNMTLSTEYNLETYRS